jgi:hypothetical protein
LSIRQHRATNKSVEALDSVIDRLKALRGPGDGYSDVIIRVARGDSAAVLSERRAGTTA